MFQPLDQNDGHFVNPRQFLYRDCNTPSGKRVIAFISVACLESLNNPEIPWWDFKIKPKCMNQVWILRAFIGDSTTSWLTLSLENIEQSKTGYPDATIHGCLFHWKQAIIRHFTTVQCTVYYPPLPLMLMYLKEGTTQLILQLAVPTQQAFPLSRFYKDIMLSRRLR